jgi:hypothetical protein
MAGPQMALKSNNAEAQTADNKTVEIKGVKLDANPQESGDQEKDLENGPPISLPTKHHEWLHTHIDWHHHHFHLWNADKLPHRSSDAHAVARAEAASWAQMTPLIAATLGPLAVLLGIPGLSQPLHGRITPDGPEGSSTIVELPYPTLNLALSIVTMILEVMGNAFLILRFSNFHANLMTWMSYIFWVVKSVIGIASYIQFGIAHPETEDIVYLQGFWVLSFKYPDCRLVSAVWSLPSLSSLP